VLAAVEASNRVHNLFISGVRVTLRVGEGQVKRHDGR